MGRLQRKKTTSSKKKKKSSAGALSTFVSNNTIVKGKALTVDTSVGVKKSQIQSRSRSQIKSRSEKGKIKQNIDTGVQFLREVKIELKKVVWPARKQAIGSTVVVIILVIIVSIFLGTVDITLSSLVRVIFQ